MKKDLIKIDIKNPKSVMQFLQQPTLKIAEFLTGVLVSEQKDWKLSAGHLVQAMITGDFLTQLGKEIQEYRDQGKVKENYLATAKNRASLYELLKFLNENVPDDELFQALKAIYLTGISADATARDESLAYEFLQAAKQMSGTEILILKANLAIAENQPTAEVRNTFEMPPKTHSRDAWSKIIATQMGYKDFYSVVGKYEENLESLGLISRRQYDDRFSSDFVPTQKFRLTEFGHEFCRFIHKWKVVSDSKIHSHESQNSKT